MNEVNMLLLNESCLLVYFGNQSNVDTPEEAERRSKQDRNIDIHSTETSKHEVKTLTNNSPKL